MQAKDLEIFNEMPFLFWVEDAEGRYIWGNQAIADLAGEQVVGKTDAELPWADNAEALRADDKQVMDTGKPIFAHEHVDRSSRGTATLNVCKFVAN